MTTFTAHPPRTAHMKSCPMARTAAKAVPAVQLTSKALNSKARPRLGERGIVLLDLVIAMVLLSFLVLMVLPSLPHGTTPSRLGTYASEIAAVLKNDRTA